MPPLDSSERRSSALFTREEIAEAERVARREILEMNLHELRLAAGKTQEQLATAARMKQSATPFMIGMKVLLTKSQPSLVSSARYERPGRVAARMGST